jgi:hypothetical protein
MSLTTHKGARRAPTGQRRERPAACYVAIGLRPDVVSSFADALEEEDARVLRVEHDDEGSALVFFQLTASDRGAWLPSITQRWGCGLAPAPRR